MSAVCCETKRIKTEKVDKQVASSIVMDVMICMWKKQFYQLISYHKNSEELIRDARLLVKLKCLTCKLYNTSLHDYLYLLKDFDQGLMIVKIVLLAELKQDFHLSSLYISYVAKLKLRQHYMKKKEEHEDKKEERDDKKSTTQPTLCEHLPDTVEETVLHFILEKCNTLFHKIETYKAYYNRTLEYLTQHGHDKSDYSALNSMGCYSNIITDNSGTAHTYYAMKHRVGEHIQLLARELNTQVKLYNKI